MWFKNLAVLRLTEAFALTDNELEQRLQTKQFRPCGRVEQSTIGWTAPLGRQARQLVHSSNGFMMLCARRQEKIVPSSVINEIVAERVAEIEGAQGRQVRRKERQSIADEVMLELLPRAFTHSVRTFAYIDPKGGWLVIDAASSKKADESTVLLRKTLESLPVAPPTPKQRPSAVMTGWLAGESIPGDVTIEDECELRLPEEEGSTVRCKRQALFSPEIQSHLDAGKEVVKLALTWDDRLSFVLDDRLSIKRLKFLDILQEQADEADAGDEAARFDAEFAVMTLELARFLPRLLELFGGEDTQQ
jgi:recombination associated protein RdgC